MILLIILFSSFLFSPLTFAQEQKFTSAVMDLEAKEGVSKGVTSMLSDYLRTQLVNTNKFTIVTRENMEQILKEQQFQLSGCTSQECIVQVGQLLGVRKMFTGTIGKLGATYLINLKIIDVQSGQIEKAETEECAKCEEDVLLISIRNIANKMVGLPALEKVPQKVIIEEKSKRGYAVSFDTLIFQSSFSLPIQQKFRDAIGWYKACATWTPLGLIPYAYYGTHIGGMICGGSGDWTLNEAIKFSNSNSLEQLLDKSGFPRSAQMEIKEAIGWYKACSGWATTGLVFEGVYWVGFIMMMSSFSYHSYNYSTFTFGNILSTIGGYGMWLASPIGGWICGAQGDEHLKKALDAYNFGLSKDTNENKFFSYFSFQSDGINTGFYYRF